VTALPRIQAAAADTTASFTATLQRFVDDPAALLPSALLVVIGVPAVFLVSRWVQRWVAYNSTPQRGLVIGRLLTYAGLLGLGVTVLSQLGFNLTPLLGAAGILGIALGFASQTSVSNLISGFFIMGEQSFVVDDIIEVAGRTGRVMSIDMLSVKLRTFDNKFIRIPNETLVKSEVVTVTRFPVRRIDVMLGVAYKEDLDRVRELLFDVARENPDVLMEPEPVFIFQGYGDSSLNIQFGVWATREKWLKVKNSIHLDIKRALDEAGIEIPFPHRTLYTGSVTDPFPVRLTSDTLSPAPDTPNGAAGLGAGGDPVVD
jgi:small-conductance mechanosensitive channel